MYNKISTVIVDDDPRARELLYRVLSEEYPKINIVAEAGSSEEAYKVLSAERPDLVFMDVELHCDSAFDIIDRLPVQPNYTIYCAENAEHALNALRRSAFDYLLKPLEPVELGSCMQKLYARIDSDRIEQQSDYFRKLEVFSNGKTHLIRHSDIIYAQAMGSYTKLFMIGGRKLVVSKNLKTIHEELGEKIFYRIHNSSVVNLRSVTVCEFGRKKCRLLEGHEVKMAVRRSDEFRKKLTSAWKSDR